MKTKPEHELSEAIYLNQVEKFHSIMQTNKFRPDILELGYYMACSEGQLEIAKAFVENKYYEFDERLRGCTFAEFGLMAACHKEGKAVRNYLIEQINLPFSNYVAKWFRDNRLTKLQDELEDKIKTKKPKL